MGTELLFVTLATGVYALASVVSVVSFVRSTDLWEKRGLQLLVLAALALGAGLAIHWADAGRLSLVRPFEVIAIYVLAITVVYLVNAMRYETRSLSVLLVPYATALLMVGVLKFQAGSREDFSGQSAWLNVHILTALAGYASFTLASALAVSYLVQDRNLKRKRFGKQFGRLPALETLDRLMSGQIAFAFIVFTMSLICGIVLTHLNHWGTRWLTDPKILAAGLTWLIYAVLVYLKQSAGQHGKAIAVITIVGFCAVLFTFFGVTALTETMHTVAAAGSSGGGG